MKTHWFPLIRPAKAGPDFLGGFPFDCHDCWNTPRSPYRQAPGSADRKCTRKTASTDGWKREVSGVHKKHLAKWNIWKIHPFKFGKKQILQPPRHKTLPNYHKIKGLSTLRHHDDEAKVIQWGPILGWGNQTCGNQMYVFFSSEFTVSAWSLGWCHIMTTVFVFFQVRFVHENGWMIRWLFVAAVFRSGEAPHFYIRYDKIWYDMICYDMLCYDMIWKLWPMMIIMVHGLIMNNFWCPFPMKWIYNPMAKSLTSLRWLLSGS